jgi:hypothetical protein
MRPILRASTLLAGIIGSAFAQQVVAPTPEPVGSARGEDQADYNITNSFETGYRFAGISGNDGKYRSDVNYRNGVKLLSSGFSANSKDGHGGLFDEILLNTQGLGGDPYESVKFRIQKNRLYRYDMLWRSDDYFNPALAIADGEHFRDTTRRMLDNDLTLFPQSRIQFHFGYSRNNQDGPALSTTQLFSSQGDIYAPFLNVKRLWNEFRVGNDIEFAGFKFSWMHAWDNFKEDSPFQLGQAQSNPPGPTSLSSFNRVEPYHGNSPFWRGNLHGERKIWALNAHITYVGAQRNFALDENAVGFSRGAINLQTLVSGNASRPTTAGDFSLSISPTERLTLVNNTSVYTTRISGSSFFDQFNNLTEAQNLLFFQFLGIRTITNSTDINLRLSPMVSFYSGYHYSTREIRSIEDLSFPEFPGPPEGVTYAQNNHIHSGIAGVRLKPLKGLTVLLDGGISRADRPFTPLSDANFHTINARVRYKAKSLALSAVYKQDYNTNSVTLSTHSSKSRNYSFDASWTPQSWFSLDAGYSKLHLDTVSGIAFFAASQSVQGLNSIFVSNIHAVNLGARFDIKKKADLYVGYTITKDTGDGRSAPSPAGTTDPAVLLLSPAQTFPLSFQSPLARLSVRLSPKVRWNVGWQFYNYRQDFQLFVTSLNYHANTGYTSVLWSF